MKIVFQGIWQNFILCLDFGNSGLKAIPLVKYVMQVLTYFALIFVVHIYRYSSWVAAQWNVNLWFSSEVKKGEAASFGFLFVWIYRCTCIIQRYSRAIFVTVEICENCTKSVLQTKFVRSLFWGLWEETIGEAQVGSTVLPPRNQLWFLSVTCSVALTFFKGVLLQQCSWKAEFVIREYSRAIDFLNKKVRSWWVFHPSDWESRFSEMAAEQHLCLW